MSKKDTVVLYHSGCNDGFAAAFAAWKKLGDSAHYIAMNYDSDIPDVVLAAKKVYMLDYSRKREEILSLSDVVDLQIIDHHESAMHDLVGLDNAIFDMSKSGAVLTWEYFHPDTKVPQLLMHVQDRDLWNFNLPETEAVYYALLATEYKFEVWDKLDVDELERKGEPTVDLVHSFVDSMLKTVTWVLIGDYKIPLVNATVLFSEVGAALLKAYPTAPFAGYYFTRDSEKIQVGLRSRKTETINVAEIAKDFGGGGHKNSSGFVIDMHDFYDKFY